jgi:glycosyltransferase involved in cell wall biosynthesis
MKVSFVIPMYNAEKTIATTLDAIMKSDYRDFEVIVVDDGSTDSSIEIVKKYNCRLVNSDKRSGAAAARNIGVQHSIGDIIFFIDSDIVIKPDTTNYIIKVFQDNQEIVAIVGILSKDNPYSDFSSQYKNLHMHYYMKNMPRYISCVYTSVTAIKKDAFLKIGLFDSKSCKVCSASVEDIELGQRISDAGFKILLDPNLQVVHFRKFTLWSLIKNDFKRAIDWSSLFFQKNGLKRSMNEGSFAYLPITAIVGTAISPFVIASLLLFLIFPKSIFGGIFLILGFLFLLCNSSFLRFILLEKGFRYFLKAVLFIFLDNIVAVTGSAIGLILSSISKG